MERKLAAILAADVVGYSRLIAEDEARTLDALRALRRESFEPLVAEHRGEVVKRMGDGWLVSFASVVDAAACAIAVQERLSGHDRIKLRIGVHLGDIVHEDEDIYGDGVNIAARLQEVAEPGGVLISGTAYESLVGRLDDRFEESGAKDLKNISRPVLMWRWKSPALVAERSAELPAAAPANPPLPDKPSLAVLPFINMSNDSDQEYFVDGITEDITISLGRVRWLFVIARNSAFSFKGHTANTTEVALALGVRYILTGNVRKAGRRLRVTVQLADALNGHPIWSERYDRELEDVFDLQDEITETVVGAIEPEIVQAELDRTKVKRPENLDAWDIDLQARAQASLFNRDALAKAVELSRQAIALDGSQARPHATLAFCRQRQLVFNFAPDREAARAEVMQAAKTAISLDRDDAEALTMMGQAIWNQPEVGLDEATGVIQRAVEANPSNAYAHSTLGLLLGIDGHGEEGVPHHETAIRLSPRDPQMALFLSRYASTCINIRNYERAVELSKEAINLSVGNLWFPFVEAATALARLGRLDEAKVMVERLRQINDQVTVTAVRNALSFRDPTLEAHYIQGLRMAGLPEE